jgi:hypothetical protein
MADPKLVSSGTIYTLFISIGITALISLASLVRAGDTKDIAENREAISRVEARAETNMGSTAKNCQEIAVLKESLKNMSTRLDKIEANQNGLSEISRQILTEVKRR